MLDPQLIKQLQKLPEEDLKNLLALHGAGTFTRQAKAVAKYWLARNWFQLIVPAIVGVVMLIPILWVIWSAIIKPL